MKRTALSDDPNAETPSRRDRTVGAGAAADLSADLSKVATCLARSYGSVAANVARRRARLLAQAGDRDLAATWRRIADLLDRPAPGELEAGTVAAFPPPATSRQT